MSHFGCRASEIEYLDGGGCFVIASPGWLNARGETGLMAELGLASGVADQGYASVTGQGTYFGSLGPYALTDPLSDRLNPTGDAETAFDGGGVPAALQRNGPVGDSLYFGFDLSDLPAPVDQQAVLQAAITFCQDTLYGDGFEGEDPTPP